MNYGISILFRAIPLAMALFCFGYGAFIYGYGDAGNRVVAGPVVFSLGMICIALFCTAATIIRQIIHTYNETTKYILPIVGYLAALITVISGICIFSNATSPSAFVAGHVITGVGFITACVATAAHRTACRPAARTGCCTPFRAASSVRRANRPSCAGSCGRCCPSSRAAPSG